MKLCKDCRFYGANLRTSTTAAKPVIPQPGESLLCFHPRTVNEIDPVTGGDRRLRRRALAYNQRQYPRFMAALAGKCGKSARWFEPIPAPQKLDRSQQ